ncbi:MAG: sigma-70 family RNA polymerase sigma factor [Firmicutes bacterium]|nr:sigma-70 family RNA polymerase sigma factor [Bacillota bacterium]
MSSLKRLDDAELARIYQRERSDAAYEELRTRYSRAIRRWALTFSMAYPTFDAEDLHQEAEVGFLGAVLRFDPSKSNMYRFAETCVRRRLCTVARQCRRVRRIPPDKEVPLMGDAVGSGSDADDDTPLIGLIADANAADPVREALNRETHTELWRTVKAVLSPKEFQVLQCYCQGGTYHQLAEQLGMSVKAVDNALARGKRKVRQCLQRHLGRYDTA